jgi:hypothetical protein
METLTTCGAFLVQTKKVIFGWVQKFVYPVRTSISLKIVGADNTCFFVSSN